MWLRVGVIVSVFVAVAPEAQQPGRTAPRSVAGVVRDAVTRAPIAGARVRVGAFNHESCEPCLASPGPPNAVTDSAGRFTIDDAPGTFVLEADQTGFAQGGFGVRRTSGRAARIDLAPGQRLDDLEILLFREAVITGRVTDETGAPVAGLTVEVSRIDARGRWTLPGWTSNERDPHRPVTDAMGYYTALVAPDEYAVAAIRGFLPTFHPSVDRLQSAALVTVDPGEVLTGIDVQLTPRRVGLVRGRFQTPAGLQPIGRVTSISLRNARFEVRGRFDRENFVVDEVPYGDYSLEITSSRFDDRTAQAEPPLEWWGRIPVSVDAATVEVGDVPPQPAIAVSGVATSSGAKTAKPARLRGTVVGAGGRPVREGWVVVFPADRRYWAHVVGEGGRFAAARVSVAGAFEIDTLLPAEYFVAAVDDLSMDGWPMESWLTGAAEGAVRVTLQRSQTRTLSPVRLRTVPVERAPVREHRRFIDRSGALERAQRPSFEGGGATTAFRR